MKVVVLTGASDGIGAEMARQLARREQAGVALVLAARSADKLGSVAADCRACGAQALVQPTSLLYTSDAADDTINV